MIFVVHFPKFIGKSCGEGYREYVTYYLNKLSHYKWTNFMELPEYVKNVFYGCEMLRLYFISVMCNIFGDFRVPFTLNS